MWVFRIVTFIVTVIILQIHVTWIESLLCVNSRLWWWSAIVLQADAPPCDFAHQRPSSGDRSPSAGESGGVGTLLFQFQSEMGALEREASRGRCERLTWADFPRFRGLVWVPAVSRALRAQGRRTGPSEDPPEPAESAVLGGACFALGQSGQCRK